MIGMAKTFLGTLAAAVIGSVTTADKPGVIEVTA